MVLPGLFIEINLEIALPLARRLLKLLPEIVTKVPPAFGPEFGEILEIVGAAYVKPLVEVTIKPSGLVTTTFTLPVLFPERVEAGTLTLSWVEFINCTSVPRFPPKDIVPPPEPASVQIVVVGKVVVNFLTLTELYCELYA